MKDILEQYELWYEPISDICKKAQVQKVKNIMQTPSAGEFVKEDREQESRSFILIKVKFL